MEVLDTTPFYAESGGQVGDEGVITSGSARFAVGDTLKIKADVFGHHGTLEEGTLNVGDTVQAQVNTAVRAATVRNHSVTHIMHKALRDTMDKLKDKLKTAAIVLAAVDGDKVQIAAGVTADSVGKLKAGELVNFVAQQVGGKGGGKPDMAMAGGTDASKLPAALASVTGWVTQQLG